MLIDAAAIRAEPMDWFEQFRPFHPAHALDYILQTEQHYKLLANLSRQFDSAILWDVGTAFGASALALAQGGENWVRSFDIVDVVHQPIKDANPAIRFSLCDLVVEPWIGSRGPVLIVLDVDPHDGLWERQFLQRLRDERYNGFVVMDDIHLNPEMERCWLAIPERKYDLTHVGHFSGTGLVCFNDEPVEFK